jgi:hypothetical protein
MNSVEHLLKIMHLDLEEMDDVSGLTYTQVVETETSLRGVYLDTEGRFPVVCQIWKNWYGLRVQMSLDQVDVCPSGYQWDALSLTC